MPRARKPPRLYQAPGTGDWYIRDGETTQWVCRGDGSRGRTPADAEQALSDYLTRKHDRLAPSQPGGLSVGLVLSEYAREHGPTVAAPKTLGYAIKALAPFWGDLTCADVKGNTCRRYAASRPSAGTARRELGVLQAALNHAHREGVLIHPVKVTLPANAPPRERWLTRAEVRAVLRVAPVPLRRLIAISVLTGTRLSAVAALRWGPSIASGYVDLDRGILHRMGRAERQTAKRRGAVAMPRQLVRYLRRQERGETVTGFGSVKTAQKAWARAREAAGIAPATLHDLKHTAVTWAFQRGMSLEGAASYFSTSQQTLERVYRHHSPHYQEAERRIMEGRG